MSKHANLIVTGSGATRVITIDRAARRNALTLDMWRSLKETVVALGADPHVRSVVLTGAGGIFSAGADIGEFDKVRNSPEQAQAYEVAVDECCDALATIPKPTFAAVSGFCLGGACHLAMSADFRIAGPNAVFGIPAARISIVYGVRATQTLLGLVGVAQAKRLLYFGQQIMAEEAARIGLVDRIVPDPLVEIADLAEVVNANAPLSIAGAKAILNGLVMGRGNLDEAQAVRLIDQAASSADFAEGRRAFAEKRPPAFTGK